MDHRKERMKSDCKKIMDSINAMCFENLNDEQVHSLVMMREIARGVVDNRVGKVSNSDVKKALSSSIEKMVESCRDVVNILGRISCEGLGEEEFQKLVRMKEIAMGIVLKRSTAVAALGGEEQADGGDDVGSEKDMYSGGVEVESRSEDDQNEVRQGVVDGETHTWNGYVPIIEGAGEERKMVVDYHEVVLRDEDAWNVGRGSVVEGMRDAGHQEQSRRVEGLMFEDDCLVVVSEFETQDVKSEVQKSWSPETPQIPISWPSDDVINLQWVQDMMFNIEQSSYGGESPMRFCDLIPVPLVDKLIDTATSILCKEPNCVQVDCQGEDSRVVVVGDIYGQFHDLLHLFEHAGLPSDNQLYVFNGNYVDRGARGLDVFLVLLAWKVLMPSRVYLLRGNHESRYCTFLYGFEEEVKTKFGEHGEYVYNKCLDCFKELPLASVIANSAYTTHGGLFRSITSSRKSKRKREESLELGSLEDLSKVKRSLIDAPDVGPNVLLTDVLWSDPSKQDGLVEKTFRERGLWWGPDCTEAFLKQSNLKLIIRSHEGPDVREDQDDFGDMLSGYSVDHVGDSGKLYTLFSAPDYPQCGEKRYNNKGVYAVLKPPNFESPSFHSFKDVGRPQADADGDNDLVIVDKPSSVTSPATGAASLSLASVSSEVDFKTLGISNPPSSSVMMGDGAGGTELVQVPKAPVVEGLPLPSELQEPHKAAYKYFLELIAGLKHMVSTREVQTRPMNEPCKSELDI
ncbi:serine/threonine-protein phosphatase 7-like isoform X1 [Rosa rugosa]|uniref:serine/threonine-protein phosphatase 7-like isoform X1 n=1 Tax=Rosa rugosa TaxID=74645 RepID=UPI002B40F934|nr:serine/threonine-protein phosphatase 7-like isoform X1 [Rosa rugosa]